MPKKQYWYRTGVVRESGIYWVDFCFHWFQIISEQYVKKVVFRKRLRNHYRRGDKATLFGMWIECEKTIYLNPATRNKGKHTPLGKTLIHELYHVLEPGAPESYVRDVAEPELWELATEKQRAFLRRYIRKYLVRQLGNKAKL